MTTSTVALQRLRATLARMYQLIGWAGFTGIALLVAASVVTALAWSANEAFVEGQARRPGVVRQSTPSVAQRDATAVITPDLPAASEVPLLLTQIKYAATGGGLEWRAADYRITTATPAQPASLEVRCTLKGPYPNVRGMLAQLKRSIPGFTIREFAASRPNSDVAEIEAKLVLAVFLQDGAAASDVPTRVVP